MFVSESGSVAASLETPRTRLVPFSLGELAELTALFRNPGVRRFLLDDHLVDEEWVASEVAASAARFDRLGAGLWSIRLLDEPDIVGFAGFREFFDPPQLQLLYGLHPEQWGRGLATEVAGRICSHAFTVLAFEQVSAAIDVPNDASRRVLERLGMSRTRLLTEGAGTAFYSLSKVAWETRAGAH